jgi:hypothetical protein
MKEILSDTGNRLGYVDKSLDASWPKFASIVWGENTKWHNSFEDAEKAVRSGNK